MTDTADGGGADEITGGLDAGPRPEGELIPTRVDVVSEETAPDHITYAGVQIDDKYRIVRPIGKGGMGTIFLGEHLGIGKEVAIKLLSSKYSGNQQVIQRFLQEARSAARIRHRNVVEIYDCGTTHDGLPFFAMELLRGIDIRRMMKRDGPLPWPTALDYMRQICSALSAAHAAGIVHRDMKPGNCFVVQEEGEPELIKVLDFGIAKVLGDDDRDQELTHTGMVMGTAHYMSPEQARSEALDKRADVYSAGVILFQMLTGRLPYEGRGFMGTLSLHLTAPVPSLLAAAGEREIPTALEAVMYRVLAKDRERRYQSAGAFAAALELIGEIPQSSLSHSLGVRAAAVRRRLGVGGMVGAAALLVALAGAGIFLAGGDAEPAGEPPVIAEARAPEPEPRPEPPQPEPEIADDPGADAEAGSEGELAAADTEGEADSDGDAASAIDTDSETDAVTDDLVVDDDVVIDDAEIEPDPVLKRTPRPRRPRPPREEPLPERPPAAAIAEALARIEPKVKGCRSRGWFPGQQIRVKISVRPDGGVSQAKVRGALAGTGLAACVERAVKAASFPKSVKGTTRTHTFDY